MTMIKMTSLTEDSLRTSTQGGSDLVTFDPEKKTFFVVN